MYVAEEYSSAERQVLQRHFTNVDRPVFALINLPEVIKAALFARYSRTHKSIRRLFLDEFYDAETDSLISSGVDSGHPGGVSMNRAERFMHRVFAQYGDDSVAQLGGAHIACEQASNLLTKVLEWGRLAAYLEQSTRYIFYNQKVNDHYRYHIPPEIRSGPVYSEYVATMDWLFGEYSDLVHASSKLFADEYPIKPGEKKGQWGRSINAKAYDVARNLLPASTTSNVGIFASGQAFEQMIIRMNAHPLQEVRDYSLMMLEELRKVIPSFLVRVDQLNRGRVWTNYFQENHEAMEAITSDINIDPTSVDEVTLVDWDDEAEDKIAAAALYAHSDLADAQLQSLVKTMDGVKKAQIIRSYVGDRKNRRHKPGRAMERSFYRFDILSDFGSFRDLQRHRMMTFDWQRLGVKHGYSTPEAIEDLGWTQRWNEAMGRMSELHEVVMNRYDADVAQYVVPFGFKIRYSMHFNVREAFHLLELRTTEQGHPDYRRVCQAMHTLIREKAGHRALADAMSFVDHNDYELGRRGAGRRTQAKELAAERFLQQTFDL